MKPIKFLFLIMFSCCYLSQTAAQSPQYVVQVAAYSDTESFNDNREKLSLLYKYGVLDKVGKANGSVLVYLRDINGNFSSKSEAEKVLNSVKKHSNFKKAYVKKSYVSRAFVEPQVKLVDNEVVVTYKLGAKSTSKKSTSKKTASVKKIVPKEYSIFTAKGTGVSISPKFYKIKLGTYSSRKTDQEIGDAYELSSYEKLHYDKLITHDFTKVGKKVCRRYYFGNYFSKADAQERKEKMEKETGLKLSIVEVD